jgi:hypothetical protein
MTRTDLKIELERESIRVVFISVRPEPVEGFFFSAETLATKIPSTGSARTNINPISSSIGWIQF